MYLQPSRRTMIEASNFTFPRPRKAESRATGKLVRCAELMARGFTPSGHFHPPSLTNFKSHKLLKKKSLMANRRLRLRAILPSASALDFSLIEPAVYAR